jgi:hypothetical protein
MEGGLGRERELKRYEIGKRWRRRGSRRARAGAACQAAAVPDFDAHPLHNKSSSQQKGKVERPKETQTPGVQDKKFHHVRHQQLILLVLFLLVLALVSFSTVLLLILVDLFMHLAQLQ